LEANEAGVKSNEQMEKEIIKMRKLVEIYK